MHFEKRHLTGDPRCSLLMNVPKVNTIEPWVRNDLFVAYAIVLVADEPEGKIEKMRQTFRSAKLLQ